VRPSLLAATAIGLLVVAGHAVADDEMLELQPHWKKGEKRQYEKVKARETSGGPGGSQSMVARSDLEVAVVSTGPKGSVLAWTAGEARFDDPEQNANPLVQRLGNLLKNARALLELDDKGKLTGVRNWKELQQASFKMRDALVDEVRAQGADQQLADTIGAQVTSMIDSREKVEDLVGRGEAQLFLLPLGVTVSESKALELDGSLPNVLGGEPIPARARFELKSLDRAAGRATIVYTQTVKPDVLQAVMERSAKEFAERTGRPGPSSEQLSGMVLEDRAEYVVDVESGWVESFTHQRVVKAGPTKQQDTVTIRRKGP
jgi:hypothetical protein